MYQLRQESQAAVDQEWSDRLRTATNGIQEVFLLLEPPAEVLAARRQQFMDSGCTVNPDLRPTNLDLARLQAQNDALNHLSDDIRDHETNQSIQEAYTERIDELIFGNSLAMMAATGDSDGFTKTNQLLYGTPDTSIFQAACLWLRAEASHVAAGISAAEPLAKELLTRLPAFPGADAAELFPDQATFQAVKDLHFAPGGYMDQLFGTAASETDLASGGMVTAATGDELVRRAIAAVGSDYRLADSTNGLWSVLHSRRQVIRPPAYRLAGPAFRGIVCHEIGSHLLEATNGHNSGLRLLELGLAGYEKGNEGRAVLREQLLYGSVQDYIDQPGLSPTKPSWQYRVVIHVVIALATGLAGRAYDFAELYRTTYLLFKLWNSQQPVHAALADEVIADGAWSLVVRALKGTNGLGGAYCKDIVYLEGNVGCWRLAQSQPAMILQGDRGKFDISNQRHVILLKELGILP